MFPLASIKMLPPSLETAVVVPGDDVLVVLLLVFAPQPASTSANILMDPATATVRFQLDTDMQNCPLVSLWLRVAMYFELNVQFSCTLSDKIKNNEFLDQSLHTTYRQLS